MCLVLFSQEKKPKASLRIDGINAALVPNKIGNPNGMQITFEQDDATRNLFVFAEDGMVSDSYFKKYITLYLL